MFLLFLKKINNPLRLECITTQSINYITKHDKYIIYMIFCNLQNNSKLFILNYIVTKTAYFFIFIKGKKLYSSSITLLFNYIN